MSDTPRTDAELQIAGSYFGPIAYVREDFARHLERELAEVRSRAVCAFCLHEMPRTIEAMAAHVAECTEHPMRAMEEELAAANERVQWLGLNLARADEKVDKWQTISMKKDREIDRLKAALELIEFETGDLDASGWAHDALAFVAALPGGE